ncbi:MAG: hypothetical protein ACHQHN_15880 [Sphingobacteriales bacterium]
MHRLKTFRLFFSLAAILFVAKPFIGFAAFNFSSHPRISYTILVKSFTKRKPETLQEGFAEAEAIYQSLSNPLLVLLSGILFLLVVLFPFLFDKGVRLTNRFLLAICASILPPGPAYLLGGKLII